MTSQHQHHPSLKQLIVAFSLTGSLTIFEIWGAWHSHSLALWGEAFHFIADMWAFSVAVFAMSSPKTPSLSFGRNQAVALGGFINGLVQSIIGVWIVLQAIEHLWKPESIEGGLMLMVASVGLLLNLSFLGWFGGFHMHQSDAIEGARIHFMSDAGLCLATVLSAGLIDSLNWVWSDAVLAIIAGGIMIYSALGLIKRVSHTLLSGVPMEVNIQEILEELKRLDKVKDVHDLHIWQVGRDKIASVHILAPQPHFKILKEAESIFKNHEITHTTIQVEEVCLTESFCIFENTKPQS